MLGRVLGPHGIRGELRIHIYGDGPDHLLEAREIALADPERGAEDPAPRMFGIEGGGTGRRGEVRLQLEGIHDRDAAQALEGRLVTIPADELPALPDDEFYWYELVGHEVVLDSGESLGRVQEIWETGAHDVLVIRDAQGRQHLIPTAREFVTDIDPEGRRITVADRPGLIGED